MYEREEFIEDMIALKEAVWEQDTYLDKLTEVFGYMEPENVPGNKILDYLFVKTVDKVSNQIDVDAYLDKQEKTYGSVSDLLADYVYFDAGLTEETVRPEAIEVWKILMEFDRTAK